MKQKLKVGSGKLKGFTLIELLVVIGVLGILAAGLLAAIDPLEQLRKGRDSNFKTTAMEFINGATRYYATRGQMPCTVATPTTLDGLVTSCIMPLINDGELKDTFDDQTSLLSKVWGTVSATTVIACFDPESKSESLRPETKYTNAGAEQAGCPSATGTCYWCAR